MKALIRLPSEMVFDPSEQTVTELTNEHLYRGPFALCEDAPPDSIASDYDIKEVTETVTTGETDEDGNEMSESVTRLIAVLNQNRYNERKSQEMMEND